MPNQPTCNICGGTEFLPQRNRPKARCASCDSMERGRLMQLVLDQEGLVKPGMKALHIAPEAGIGRKIRDVVGYDGYRAVDLRPSIYPADLNVEKFDLMEDIFDLPSEAYDLIIHSHVLEHLPCELGPVLYHLHRSLTETGAHVFCVPVLPGSYETDFAELSREERTKRFGQFDHVRRFGQSDFSRHLGMIFELNPCPPKISREEYAKIGAPYEGNALTSNTVFVQNKQSIRMKEKRSISLLSFPKFGNARPS